ncbi:putative nuclease HARBI1 [Rhipicephalus sanguineus]|uniref:putative nuclease HARBI1 n=1 Tax=Rhipicephalus sanguineus TaxID=34632 RepID=UPI0020C589B3|nr:putative nuclease HARBI1 [Rhipicephalus sanguineus]
MSQSSVSNTIHEVAEAIIVLGRRRKLVDFPLTAAAKEEAKAAFARLGRIPGVLARVDGTLIAIEKPEGLSIADTASFMTRKGCATQASASWSSTPVFQDHAMKRLAAQLQPGEYVLGDSGYPLEPWLMIPVPGHPRGVSPECLYNKELSSMRHVVERCIGMLKSRFRCLQRYRTLFYSPDRAGAIVSACASLHNIALEEGEPVFDEDVDSGEMPGQDDAELPQASQALPSLQEIYLRGRQQRDAVVSLF